MVEWLDLLFDNDFDLSNGCSSDEEFIEGSSQPGSDELHPQELNTLEQ